MNGQFEVVKKIGEVDIDRILLELENKKIDAQFPLQGAFEDDWRGACGKTYDLRSDEKDYIVKLYQDMPYTYSILEKYSMYRSRVMKLIPGRCYSYHVEHTPRIHIPLESNEKSFFIIDDQVFRLPADGSVYWVDTRKIHTAVNANLERIIRTHIIGNVNE